MVDQSLPEFFAGAREEVTGHYLLMKLFLPYLEKVIGEAKHAPACHSRNPPVFSITSYLLHNEHRIQIHEMLKDFFAQRKGVCVGVSLYLCRSLGYCSGQPMH